jgi:putative phage-type endonuclease
MTATTEFSNKDVTMNRNQMIGGSDIAAILGMSRWKTPLKLWAEKTDRLPAPDLSNVEAVELGTDLEEFVAKKFTQKTGKAVRRSPKYYQHPNYPYMVAHVDRLVTGTDELLECKTCSAFKKDEWENDEIPQEYILQVMWYLGITGRKVGHIAVLIGGQSFKYKQIEFDQELFDTMVEAAKDFWQKVQDEVPPEVMPNDDDTLKDMYQTHTEAMVELFPTDDESAQATSAIEEKIAYLQEIKGHIKSFQDEQKAIETSLKDIIQGFAGIKTPRYVVTWKSQSKTNFNTKAFKEAHKDLFEEYAKETSYRVMRITKNKENEVA